MGPTPKVYEFNPGRLSLAWLLSRISVLYNIFSTSRGLVGFLQGMLLDSVSEILYIQNRSS